MEYKDWHELGQIEYVVSENTLYEVQTDDYESDYHFRPIGYINIPDNV